MHNDCSKTIFPDRIYVSYRVIWFKINIMWYSIFISNNKTLNTDQKYFSNVLYIYRTIFSSVGTFAWTYLRGVAIKDVLYNIQYIQTKINTVLQWLKPKTVQGHWTNNMTKNHYKNIKSKWVLSIRSLIRITNLYIHYKMHYVRYVNKLCLFQILVFYLTKHFTLFYIFQVK